MYRNPIKFCDFSKQFPEIFLEHARFILFPADIDLDQNVCCDVSLDRLSGDFLCELNGVDGLDQVDLADNLANLICLQMADKLQRTVIEVIVLVFCKQLLNPVLADMVESERNSVIDCCGVYGLCCCKKGDVLSALADLLSRLGDFLVDFFIIVFYISE